MKAIIVHGWGADSSSNWFPWLKKELEKIGIETYCPNLPNTSFPNKQEWINELRSQTTFDDDLVLIGHSLGCPAILRLLESFGKNERVRAAVLVAGFADYILIPPIRNFTEGGFDFSKVRKGAKEFFVINSDNDPFVPLDMGKKLAQSLNTELILEKGAGHINMGDGYLKYARVLDIIKKLVG